MQRKAAKPAQRDVIQWEPRSHPAYLLTRAARLFNRRADDRLREIGFGAAQVPVLRALKDGEARSQTELAAMANIEQPTMAIMLARMVRDGSVRKSPNPADGRSSLYALTPHALAKLPAARDVLAKGGAEMLSGFGINEVALLESMLKRALANLSS